MSVFYIKQGDLYPLMRAALLDNTGAPINLTTVTGVTFKMRSVASEVLKVSAAAAVISAAGGVVEYTWVLGDTDTVGTYSFEWLLNYGAEQETVPNNGYGTLVIGARL